MTPTENVIRELVADASAVERGPPLGTRAFLCVALGLFGVAAATVGFGPRPDLAARLVEPLFLVGVGGAILTGTLGSVASLAAGLPDRSRLWLLLPMPAAVLWLATVTGGCLGRWVALEPGIVSAGDVLRCVGMVVAIGLPLAIAMGWTLRPLARVRPAGTVATAGLAAAGFAAAALALTHSFDASALLLVWNLGLAATLAGAAYGYETRFRLGIFYPARR